MFQCFYELKFGIMVATYYIIIIICIHNINVIIVDPESAWIDDSYT